MMWRYLGCAGLLFTMLLIPVKLSATDKNAVKESESLVFWAVNEGGARIYQPNSAACAKISGLSVQYAEGISNKFNVPAYTLKIAEIKPSADLNTCTLMIDTPKGLKECAIGSVIQNFGGDYLAHSYQQFGDGRVTFLNGDCH
jgi:hypothetical protein